MTNHGETTGPIENGDTAGRESPHGSAYEAQVTLRTPAELADALPYLLGYRPEDSVVLVALHDREGRGRFGGRARLAIPASEDDWEAAARQLTHGLVAGSERRGTRPEQMVAYVCQEPGPGETGRDVRHRLQPLVHLLRTQCGTLDVPVVEALCISDGRFWSYCCPTEGCCPEDGSPMGLPGTSVLAAAATYAGIQVRGTLRELRARLLPRETTAALEQEIALDAAGASLVPRLLDDTARAAVAEETLDLAERIMHRFAAAPPVSGAHPADVRDDGLLTHDEAAALVLGLQDRTTRDRAAAWMEGDEAGPALRLWRALARRCVGPYGEHAAAPLTLAGWVAWSTGDELEAREALAMALGADPDYLFARLLHQACNEGLDPESIRRCLRAERDGRARPDGADGAETAAEAVSEGASETTAPGPSAVAAAAAGGRTDGCGTAPAPGANPRRRTRPVDGGGGARPSRGEGGRRRPAGPHPLPPAAGSSRPGSAGPTGTRARTGGAASGSTTADGGRRETGWNG
ncbi:DUF4192 family protein [Streptomyces sp. TG1A-8]|uniref:DUF4192 domain-containing protein n=1 Tax=Streptomyces sp. TG1A-8 TaxID=3051385 RepID=UPI00265C3732|nr:DUF4192 domain-containing protein [Streptomyces sp. TG1A-8]MDO0925382.1 DUF4192 family protein [Streptomyces sp. TG1A-8]